MLVSLIVHHRVTVVVETLYTEADSGRLRGKRRFQRRLSRENLLPATKGPSQNFGSVQDGKIDFVRFTLNCATPDRHIKGDPNFTL